MNNYCNYLKNAVEYFYLVKYEILDSLSQSNRWYFSC